MRGKAPLHALGELAVLARYLPVDALVEVTQQPRFAPVVAREEQRIAHGAGGGRPWQDLEHVHAVRIDIDADVGRHGEEEPCPARLRIEIGQYFGREALIGALGAVGRRLIAQHAARSGHPILVHEADEVIVEHAVIARMPDRHVVVLEIVVDRCLPVAVPDLGHDRAGRTQLLELVGRDEIGVGAPHLFDRGPARDHAHEHEAMEHLELDRIESEAGAIEAWESLGSRQRPERPLMGVVPAVIRTDDRALAVSRAIEQPRAAVTAHVLERPQLALAAADDDDAVAHHVQGHVVTGVLHLAHMAGELPRREDETLVLEVEQGLALVGPGGQADEGALGHGSGGGFEMGHDWTLLGYAYPRRVPAAAPGARASREAR